MDFIERLFGLSPYAGNGAFEFLCFAVITLTLYAIGTARQRRRHTPPR